MADITESVVSDLFAGGLKVGVTAPFELVAGKIIDGLFGVRSNMSQANRDEYDNINIAQIKRFFAGWNAILDKLGVAK